MKLANLPQDVIDRGFHAKHEFFLSWNSFVTLSQNSYYQSTEEDLAEFIEYENRFILLPVERSHHPDMSIIRGMISTDMQSITLIIQDSHYSEWFTEESDARYGFLAIADRYQKFNCDFYLANYYHFSYLVNADYEAAKNILNKKLNS